MLYLRVDRKGGVILSPNNSKHANNDTKKWAKKGGTMKKWYVSMAVLALVLVTTVVFAQGPGSGPGNAPSSSGSESYRGPGPYGQGWGRQGFEPGWGRFHERFGEGSWLGLSKEQIDKMQALRDRIFNETRDLRYEMAEKRLEMRKLFTDPKISDATLTAKQKEMSALRQKLQDKMAQMMIEGRKILTPEQLQKLDRGGMGGAMGFGGMGFGMGGGPMAGGPMGSGMMGRGMIGRGPMGRGMGCDRW